MYSQKFKDGDCRCGRKNLPIHCRNCGSKYVYACDRAGLRYMEDGKLVEVPGFTCRKCRIRFNLAIDCEAPQFITKTMAQKRAMDSATEGLQQAIADATRDAKTPEEAHAIKMRVLGEFTRRRIMEQAK